ncbi:MAG TPA: hypothetical protein VNQ80_15385 [Parapedobacter sp.]|uniref:hypothetical protein n=1 Tax=Parapedobacter sp. TaxID=1958893 RepID=UPI002CE077F8|nr:hypothetical protein [Parapedobacter sp.]HWK58725.1 hypothetical protein [Parapedobacter sp.]
MKNFSKGLGLAVGLLLTALLSLFVANAVGKPALLGVLFAVFLIGGLVPRGNAGVLRAEASPDISALAAYAGKYAKGLYRRFVTGIQVFNDITPMFNVKNKVNLHKLTVSGGPMPYSGIEESNPNDIKLSGQVLEVDDWQRDITIEPKKYRTIYLAEDRGPGEGATNTRIPYAQFTLETVADENASAINNQTVWNGVGRAAFSAFNPASTYDVGDLVRFNTGKKDHYFRALDETTAGQSPATHPAKWLNVDVLAICEGLGTKIRTLRTADALGKVVTTGSLATDAYSKFKAVYRGVPEVVRANRKCFMYSSLSSFEALLDDFEGDISKYTDKDLKLVTLPTSNGNCILKPVTWMSGSQQLVCTPKENLIAATDLLGDYEKWRPIEKMYTIDFGLTGVLGFGVQDPEVISTNDMS